MPRPVPIHLGIILDGNRRWARAAGLTSLQGHRAGYDNFDKIARYAAGLGVKYISAYVFSTENWQRDKREVDFLMDLFLWVATKKIDDYHRDGFRIVFLGSRDRLNKKLLAAIDAAEAKTNHNTYATVALCLNYGGQLELADAVRRIISENIPADEVTPEVLSQYVYHPEVPPIDLLIRTSGEQRLSNFMLWRVAYAELEFSDKYWPDFSEADLDSAITEFGGRQRRRGR